ncbi:porin family protein [Mucilaginibacter antarcticus]|uniref:Porin family protein n=1 Tax=Mucilaginibacter antarcticus TaxID=1855725 RepID=A0ABW5XUP8_9SPHI
MKKYVFSLLILAAASISTKAQVNLGVKAGVNFSKINTDNLNESTKTGYQAGIFARFGSALYLQPELYLSSTGGKFSGNNSTGNYNADVKFTNLNVPLLIGHSFGGESLNFRVMAGPIYTYVLDKNENLSANLGPAYADFGNYKNSTIGYQAGAGVDIGAITADLRYEGNLTKISDSYGQRQNLWALSVGFKFF